MALRDQPYLPLYIQDVLTDEKLIECTAAAHGIYFRLICILHKQEKYGLLCLKQKYKQNESKIICFAQMLCVQMPFEAKQIAEALTELVSEKVIYIEEDNLFQKRMVKDGELSLMRTEIGKKGGCSVTKQYGKPGFLYLMSDLYGKHKIGISKNPQNRLYRLRSDLKLPKHFDIIHQIEVNDMGKTEDFAQNHFGNLMDGEWIKSDYATVLPIFEELIVLLKPNKKANSKANTESEYEDENEYNIIKKESVDFDFFWHSYDKKVGDKDKIKKKWYSLSFDIQNKILEHIPKYKVSQPEKQYRKDPATYLNNKSWEDEIIHKASSPQNKLATAQESYNNSHNPYAE